MLLNNDVITYLKQFDIISLQETWLTDYDMCRSVFSEYSIFSCKAKKSVKGGRNMGGVVVLVKNVLSKHVRRVCDDFQYGVILVLDKSMFAIDNNVLFCSLYVPPEHSPCLSGEKISVLQRLEDILLNEHLLDMHLILNGDFNARTGHEPDFITYDDNIPEMHEYTDILDNPTMIPRTSQDDKVNKYGYELIDFCKTYACYIVNGRIGYDKNRGDFTFINDNGCSVIDYFIVSKEMFDLIDNFTVACRPEKDHLPCSCVTM